MGINISKYTKQGNDAEIVELGESENKKFFGENFMTVQAPSMMIISEIRRNYGGKNINKKKKKKKKKKKVKKKNKKKKKEFNGEDFDYRKTSERMSSMYVSTKETQSQLGIILKQDTNKIDESIVISLETSEESSSDEEIITINIDTLERSTGQEQEIAGKLDESFTIAVETSSGESSTGDACESLIEKLEKVCAISDEKKEEKDFNVEKNVKSKINTKLDEGIITDPENSDKYELFPKDYPQKIQQKKIPNDIITKEECSTIKNKIPQRVWVRRSDYWSRGAIFPQPKYKLDPPDEISPRYYQNFSDEKHLKNPFILKNQINPPLNVEDIDLSLLNPDLTPKKQENNNFKETSFTIKLPPSIKRKPQSPPTEWHKKIKTTKELIKEMKQFSPSTLDILEYDRNGKCYSRSVNYLKSGYKYLSHEQLNYDKAIVKFTTSVANSIPGSIELCHAYAARSSALFEVGLISDAIIDIERALSFNLSNNEKGELYRIRAIYIKSLYPFDDQKIVRAFDKVREYVKYLDDDEQKRNMINKIERQEKEVTCKTTVFYKENYKKYTPKVEKINKRLPGLSKLVDLTYSDQEINSQGDIVGRLIYAERDIQPGTVIASEKPYAFVVYPKYVFKICDNCAEQTWSGVPCKNCTEVIYCSKECRRLAWRDYHDIECRIIHALRQIDVNFIFFIALRLVVKAFKEYGYSCLDLDNNLAEIDRNNYDPLKVGFTNGIFDAKKYASVWSMVCHEEKPWSITKYQIGYCVMIAHLLVTRTKIIGKHIHGSLRELSENTEFIFLVDFINRNVLISRHNSIHIGDKDDKKLRLIVPSFSLFNHSCVQKTCPRFYGENLTLTTLYPVEKGEEVFYNFGSYYDESYYEPRRMRLYQRYHVNCHCDACVNKWPVKPIKVDELRLPDRLYNRENIKELFLQAHKKYQRACTRRDDFFESLSTIDLSDSIEKIISIVRILVIYLKENTNQVFDAIQLLNDLLCFNEQRYITLPTKRLIKPLEKKLNDEKKKISHYRSEIIDKRIINPVPRKFETDPQWFSWFRDY